MRVVKISGWRTVRCTVWRRREHGRGYPVGLPFASRVPRYLGLRYVPLVPWHPPTSCEAVATVKARGCLIVTLTASARLQEALPHCKAPDHCLVARDGNPCLSTTRSKPPTVNSAGYILAFRSWTQHPETHAPDSPRTYCAIGGQLDCISCVLAQTQRQLCSTRPLLANARDSLTLNSSIAPCLDVLECYASYYLRLPP